MKEIQMATFIFMASVKSTSKCLKNERKVRFQEYLVSQLTTWEYSWSL